MLKQGLLLATAVCLSLNAHGIVIDLNLQTDSDYWVNYQDHPIAGSGQQTYDVTPTPFSFSMFVNENSALDRVDEQFTSPDMTRYLQTTHYRDYAINAISPFTDIIAPDTHLDDAMSAPGFVQSTEFYLFNEFTESDLPAYHGGSAGLIYSQYFEYERIDTETGDMVNESLTLTGVIEFQHFSDKVVFDTLSQYSIEDFLTFLGDAYVQQATILNVSSRQPGSCGAPSCTPWHTLAVGVSTGSSRLASVPEPGVMGLFAAGLFGLIIRRRGVSRG
ncbi:PEP-CTERM sorting domain-containing protein [Aestuariibacter halophilus]|uniref:PEP-CTERM sorting domain-containing protein n=1 Tax=Fluctibacter halophilus TaxID=226011 RepID=A0ABS8G6U8_9ALTE|nr:PEP-CTERM sorting domain-containing protein [Aestuariibacter halophilus]MCC2616319.1 PEP-CTERM sorting domain-containing protein [Aestuariibacter halophilus]